MCRAAPVTIITVILNPACLERRFKRFGEVREIFGYVLILGKSKPPVNRWFELPLEGANTC